MKLLGFIEDQKAELLDITEDQLRLRVGRTWWERLWYGVHGHAPLEMRLDLSHRDRPAFGPHQKAHATHSKIDVAVRPLSRNWKPEPFETEAERLVHRLRWHLMVG